MVKSSMRKLRLLILALTLGAPLAHAQIDVHQVLSIGRNAIYFNDYIVSMGYFNQVIGLRPWMAEPYFYRSVAKINLEVTFLPYFLKIPPMP